MKKRWNRGRDPVLWRVQQGQYGLVHAWRKLFRHVRQEGADWFVYTKKGDRILYVEADATTTQHALALAKGAGDLSIREATHAFRTVEMVAWGSGVRPTRMMRVLLADSLQELKTGGGGSVCLGVSIFYRRFVSCKHA